MASVKLDVTVAFLKALLLFGQYQIILFGVTTVCPGLYSIAMDETRTRDL